MSKYIRKIIFYLITFFSIFFALSYVGENFSVNDYKYLSSFKKNSVVAVSQKALPEFKPISYKGVFKEDFLEDTFEEFYEGQSDFENNSKDLDKSEKLTIKDYFILLKTKATELGGFFLNRLLYVRKGINFIFHYLFVVKFPQEDKEVNFVRSFFDKKGIFVEGVFIYDYLVGELDTSLSSFPWIKSYEKSLSFFPLSLNLKMKYEKPELIVSSLQSDWLLSKDKKVLGDFFHIQKLLNQEGLNKIMEEWDLSDLIRIRRDSKQTISRKLDSSFQVESAVEFFDSDLIPVIDFAIEAKDLGGFPFIVDSIILEKGDEIKIIPKDEKFVVLMKLSDSSHSKKALEMLPRVYRDLKARNELATKIDLRFQNQAIVE